MKLEEVRANLGELLNAATKSGAFDLVQANAAINSLIAFDKHLQSQPMATASESDPIPPDPSKPKP